MSYGRTSPVEKISQFISEYNDKNVEIFLHTSMVLDTTANLRMLKAKSSSKVKFWLPENCCYELKLLAKYGSKSAIRDKAALMLELFGSAKTLDFSMMYRTTNFFVNSNKYVYLFVFYEPAVAEEFSVKIAKCKRSDNVHILSCNPYADAFGDAVCTFYRVGQTVKRRCVPLDNKVIYRLDTDRLSVRDISDNEVQVLYKDDLEYKTLGGEAELYTSSRMPGKFIKLYTSFAPGKYMERKLKVLVNHRDWLSGAFPTHLVYDKDNKCVGFVMNKVEGEKLRTCLDLKKYETDKSKYTLIAKLSAILLEMRINQLIVADLSANNIYVANNGALCMIDTDSMEVLSYPGGGTTPPYGHPDITTDCYYKKLRTFEQTNFSYAVLLFYILAGWENPVSQGRVDGTPVWRVNEFPLAVRMFTGAGRVRAGAVVNSEKLHRWKSLPGDVRAGFYHVFTFDCTYDIGSWMMLMKHNIKL